MSVSVISLRWLKHESAHLKSNDIAFETSLKKFQQQLPELQYEIKSQRENIDEWLKKVKATKVDWVEQEAAYLIKQATYQLKLANLDGATEFLNDAANILNTTAFAEVEGAKQQLTKIISVLKATRPVDRDALINQLTQLKQAVNQLPLALPEFSHALITSASKQEHTGFWWPLKASWEQIRQLMTIRYHDKSVEPLVTPQQDIYLRQNLQLQLEEACMAVLYRDQQLYHATLMKIESWVKQFFDPRAKTTQAFLQKTGQLAQIEVQTASPDVFADLNTVLKTLMASSISKE
jgi:uroporphyrin-3 C-methyltransferase